MLVSLLPLIVSNVIQFWKSYLLKKWQLHTLQMSLATLEFLINVMLIKKDFYHHVFMHSYSPPNKGVMDGKFPYEQINAQHVY